MATTLTPALAKMTILIVDDAAANLAVAMATLEQHGFLVLVAQDGEEGVERARYARPDLILLDVMMPGLSGFDTCRRLKAHTATRHIPVIFMTALSDSGSLAAGFEAGAVDYVTKPLRIPEMVARINSCLKLYAMKRQLAAQNQTLRRHRELLEQEVAQRTLELDTSNQRLRAEIGEREALERQLRRKETEFRTLVEHSPDAIERYDRHCRRLYANARAAADLGASIASLIGAMPCQVPGGPDGLLYTETIGAVFADGQPASFERRWGEDGIERCVQVRINPEYGPSGEVVSVLAVGRDISEIDRYRKRIHHQAYFDALTDLPNRAQLSHTLRHAIGQGARFGLLMLDLDHFKEVNDALGHEFGDRVLCETALRLSHCIRSPDMLVRLGGDEFALLLMRACDADSLAAVAGTVLKALAQPFMVDGRELFVSCSIGITCYPNDSEDVNGLLKDADAAMYFAKKQGRNNFQFYTSELTSRSHEKLDLEAGLRKACANGELKLFYQPQIDLHSGRVVGAEALLRWERAGHEMVPPCRFIPVAEESDLIVEIGEWVLLHACAAAADWNRGQATPMRVAVNVSTRQFIRNDLVGTVRRILAETGCKSDWLELEITESLLLEDSLEVTRMLGDFDRMGVAIAIDDFGTGYSALSYLNRFPVGQLKIDQSFVRGIPGESGKCELIKAMLSIAAALELETVAEGVETTAQAAYLTAHGCHLAQGYLYGKPVPRPEFEALLWAAEPA